MDLNQIKSIHFVGIKGVGLAALARVAKDMGKNVTGSDTPEIFITDESLNQAGIKWNGGFEINNLPQDCDLVVYTAAHGGSDNPQVVEAIKRGIKTLSYGRSLAYFFDSKKVIAVSGTHGKTTTTAMLATILDQAGLEPSWVVGTGLIPTLPSNGKWGKGQFAVIEADEYVDEAGGKPKFLHLNPYGLIITSLDWDHPDVFKTPKIFVNAFKKLIKRVWPNGILVLKGDDKDLRRLAKGLKQKIRWILPKKIWHNLKLSIPGQFNYSNATFAATMAHELGVPQAIILDSLKQFKGVQRRLEYKGIKSDWLIFDDYAHHPNEIKAALAALKQAYPDKKITVVFQPHTYSRTQALAQEFSKSFELADTVLITPTFSSARESKPVKPVDLISLVQANHANVKPIVSSTELIKYLNEFKSPNQNIMVTMGAGDIYQWIE